MSSGKIERRRRWAGSGMLNTPEHIEELQERRLRHERATRGEPEKPFSDWLDEKVHGIQARETVEDEQIPEKGAKDPYIGLSPGQSPDLARSGKGRRAGRVIIKG